MTVADPILKPTRKYWTKEEYYRIVELGGFEGQRIFLFRGEIIQMPPQKYPHSYTIMELSRVLFGAYGDNYSIRVQLPFDAHGNSEPEPDFLVCTKAAGKRKRHPNEAVLVIEVAWSSVEIDKEKAKEYAASNVPEYWLIDVDQKQLIRHTTPLADAVSVTGFSYSEMRVFQADAELSLPGIVGKTFKLADCLPE